MKPLWEVADFVRMMRRQMRFGELSRAPLRLLRLELQGESAQCDWMMRPPDAWDESLRPRERERNVSQQALRDAIALRELFFDALPGVQKAVLRTFRQSAPREPPELILFGAVTREEPATLRVSSLPMRAKLHGFQFHLEDGILGQLQQQVEEPSLELTI